MPIALSARYDNSSWTRVAVLRDPVDRFASAYLDKCMRAENGNCPDVEHRLDVRAVLTRLEEQYAQDVTSVNRHFLAQANFCQLRDMHSSFSIVPFPRIEEGWASMVRRLSLASENLRPPLLQWTKKFISSGAHANHRTNASILAAHWRRAAAAKEPHADSDILPRLMALYEDDYSLISSVNSWAVPPPRNSQGNVSLATTDAPALRSQKIARWPMRGHSRGPGTVPTPPALNRPSGWGSATKRKRGSSLH